jgi:hypothetical protein
MAATIAPPNKLTSTGLISRSLGVMPGKVLTAARELGIQPALTVDERAYFSAADADRIAEHIDREAK